MSICSALALGPCVSEKPLSASLEFLWGWSQGLGLVRQAQWEPWVLHHVTGEVTLLPVCLKEAVIPDPQAKVSADAALLVQIWFLRG